MRRSILKSVSLLFIAATTVFAQDTVVFKNGDILTGKILKQDAERVYFKSPAFGSVGLSMRDIAEIRPDGAVPAAPSAASAPVQMTDTPEPQAPTGTKPEPLIKPNVQMAKVPAPITPESLAAGNGAKAPEMKTAPKEKMKWSGQAGMAIAKRKSNTLRRRGETLVENDQEFETYRLYGNVKWKYKSNSIDWDWNYRYGKTDLRKVDDYYNVIQKYKYDFTPRYFATTKTVYQRDYRRGIVNEYLQTAEMGVKWLNTPKLKFTTSVGGGYHKYNRINSKYSDSNRKFVLDESMRWQMVNSLTLFQKYTHLGDLKNYHLVFSSGLENKLIKNLFLQLEYRIDRDTEVNYSDRSYYDKALLTKLLYKF